MTNDALPSRYNFVFLQCKTVTFCKKYNCGKSRFNSKRGAQAPKVVTDLASVYSLNRLLPFMFKGVFMIEEVWKDVVGYEGYYLVSNMGNVRRVSSNRILKLRKVLGYHKAALCMPGITKHCAVHRLVVIAFLGREENKPHVNHINGIKHDNRLENLEWCTRSENMRHAIKTGLSNFESIKGEGNPSSKLTEKDVREIRFIRAETKLSLSEIAKKYNVTKHAINDVVRFKCWKHVLTTEVI